MPSHQFSAQTELTSDIIDRPCLFLPSRWGVHCPCSLQRHELNSSKAIKGWHFLPSINWYPDCPAKLFFPHMVSPNIGVSQSIVFTINLVSSLYRLYHLSCSSGLMQENSVSHKAQSWPSDFIAHFNWYQLIGLYMFIKPKKPPMVDRKNQRVSLQFFPKVPSFSPAKPRTLWAVGVPRWSILECCGLVGSWTMASDGFSAKRTMNMYEHMLDVMIYIYICLCICM